MFRSLLVSLLLAVPIIFVFPSMGTTRTTSDFHWITLPCKFADIASETPTVNTIDVAFGDTFGGMKHYWMTVTHGALALTQTSASWKTLPHPKQTYTNLADPAAQKAALFADCTGVHDADVDFTQYDGLNLTFNASLGGLSDGAPINATLDGQSRTWAALWLMPEVYNTEFSGSKLIAQYMAKAFGWLRSNNYDGDAQWWDNPWDMTSKLPASCVASSAGCVAQFPISDHLLRMGWLSATASYNGTPFTNTLEYLDAPAVSGVNVIIIPIDGTRYYTVEARRNVGSGYDQGLPGTAVIIHEVDPARTEPAWLVGGVDNDSSAGPPAMWIVGETFVDPYNAVRVRIDSKITGGFIVTVGEDATPTHTPTLDPSITPTLNATQTLLYMTPTPTIAPTLSGLNLLKNGTFESYHEFTKIPDHWRIRNQTGDKVRCNTSTKTFAHSGACAFMFRGSTGENTHLIQRIDPLHLKAGDNVVLSLQMNGKNLTRVLTVKFRVRYTNGLSDGFTIKAANNSGKYSQFVQGFQLTSAPSKVRLQMIYRQPAGKIYVDDIQLLRID